MKALGWLKHPSPNLVFISVNGGANRDRTDDLYNAIVALSQLSYGPDILILV